MTDPFRLAIVGTGKIAADSHLPAALASRATRVAALVDANVDRAQQLARSLRLDVRTAPRLADVLGDVDGVLIATPNNTHAALALECVAAGVPALVEKPLACTVADAEQVVRAVEASGVTLAVGYCTRFQDNVQLVKSLLESRFFGAIRRFAYQFGGTGGYASLSGFHLDRDAVGGGILVTTGTHTLDRLLYWFGYPDAVALEDDSLGGPEANAVATLRYQRAEQAFEGTARFSKTVSLVPGFAMETEAGTVLMRDAEDAPVLLRPGDRPELELTLGRRGGRGSRPRDRFLLQLDDFVAACRESRPPSVPARDGLEAVRLTEELYARRAPLRLGS